MLEVEQQIGIFDYIGIDIASFLVLGPNSTGFFLITLFILAKC